MNTSIPKTVRFPFGYVVKVVTVKDRDELGIATHDPDPGYSAFDPETRTIYLQKSRPIRLRRADLIHEVGHACIDWAHEAYNTIAEAKG